MLTVQSLNLVPVWLNPGHLMATARILMAGHGLKSIGVVDYGRLVGLLNQEQMAHAPEDARVGDYMEEPAAIIDARSPVRKAAEIFVQRGLERAPVVLDDQFIGILTATDLLKELGRSYDPLTELSWSDRLREWGIENLRAGREIVVLFVDLDNFGAYNKRYGHIVGDKVLRKVADLLKDCAREDGCILVRYGGDEFAIGLVGVAEDGERMAEMLRRRQAELVVPEAQEPVTFCIGMAGGKRTRERENTHYASTLDNLINLASQDCIRQKHARQEEEGEPPSPIEQEAEEALAPAASDARPPMRVLSVHAEENSPMSLTQVVVAVGDGVVSGVNTRMGRSVIESVAVATGKALERAFPGVVLELESVNLTESPTGERLVTVSGNLLKNGASSPIGGVRAVDQDLYGCVAEATLQAFESAIEAA